MTKNTSTKEMLEPKRFESVEALSSEIKLSRRTFVQSSVFCHLSSVFCFYAKQTQSCPP